MFLRKMRAHSQIVREASNIMLILGKRKRRKFTKVVKIGNYLTICAIVLLVVDILNDYRIGLL